VTVTVSPEQTLVALSATFLMRSPSLGRPVVPHAVGHASAVIRGARLNPKRARPWISIG
jgi:hypothetical protein